MGSIDAVPQRGAARSRRTKGVDKSALTLPEPRRVRDREHLRSVAQKACLVCGRKPSDPHHLRFAQLAAWDKRSVTSLPYRCVEDIIANCTAQAMRWHGGAARGSTQHRRPARSGSKAIRGPASTAATQLHRTITVSPQISRAGTLQGHSNIPSRNHDLPSGHFTPLL